jgi:hypothetical protein
MSDFRTRLQNRILALLEKSPEHPALPPLKPASELSRDEIAQELWCRDLTFSYTQHQEHFDCWWKLLTAQEREWLSVGAECFPSHAAWLRASMRVSNSILSDDTARAGVRHLQYKLSHINLVVRDRQGAIALRDALSRMISSEFALEDGRPLENQARDRMWSLRRHQGLPYKRIAELANAGAIRKAIEAHRKRNAKQIWALRIAIFVTGFPAPDSIRGLQRFR